MYIHIENNQTDLPFASNLLEQVTQIAQAILAQETPVKFQEFSCYFVDTPTICDLHAKFFDDPSPTDCISFPMEDDPENSDYPILGDVFVCPQTAKEYVADTGQDVYEETTLYVVHGILHLLGYDDIEEGDEKEMRTAEKRCMDMLKQKDLLLKAAS